MAQPNEISSSFDQIYHDNEIEANFLLSAIMLGISVFLVIFFSYSAGLYSTDSVLIVFLALTLVVVVLNVIVLIKQGDVAHGKYVIMLSVFVFAAFVDLYLSYNAELVFLVPIVLSLRYYSPRLTRNVTVIAAVVMVVFCFLSGYVGFYRGDIDIAVLESVPAGTTLTVGDSVAGALIDGGYVSLGDVMYLKGVGAVAYAAVIVMVGIVAYVASGAGARMLQRQVEIERSKNAAELQAVKHQAEMARLENQISVSQVQPHFLYNSLSTISALCEIDPEGARDALEQFSDYMRVNMTAMRDSRLVPFSQELEHTKTYVMLEQLRFGDDVCVEYDIQRDNFEVPSLSLQPLVENAIKHGICAREEGGTVRISTRDRGSYIEITIQDDGVGYDTSAKLDDTHVGLANTRERLRVMCEGSIRMESKPGVGTTARVLIPSVFSGPRTAYKQMEESEDPTDE